MIEKQTYGDIEFQNLLGGLEFGKRFIYHMVWAKQKYVFDHFVRMMMITSFVWKNFFISFLCHLDHFTTAVFSTAFRNLLSGPRKV